MTFISRFSVRILCALSALWLAVSTTSAADTYAVGSAVAPFAAKDQFGASFQLAPDCRVLLVSFDMATGKQANVKLSALGKQFLPERHAVFASNIQGMPAIGRTFALPKMRSYAHRIVLLDDAALLAPFPRQAERVTVLFLRKGKVTSIRYWDPAKEDVVAVIGGVASV